MRMSFLSSALLSLLACSGCVAVSNAKFNLSMDDVRPTANEGDKYCVIEIREDRMASKDHGQGPPAAGKVQSNLEAVFPQWFSSGLNAIPVVVESRTSAPSTTDAHYLPYVLNGMIGVCTLGLVPFIFEENEIVFSTCLCARGDSRTPQAKYRGTTHIWAGNPLTLNMVFPKSRGWKPIEPSDPKPRFDQNEDRWLDAFCASVALAVQKLTDEERTALRENNEAWWLDAKLGNKRNRPVSIVRAEPPPNVAVPALPEASRPQILSQNWNSGTRTGNVVFRVAGQSTQEETMAWLKDEYLPEYCRTLGVVVSADNPGTTPAADIRVKGVDTLPDGTFRLSFSLAK